MKYFFYWNSSCRRRLRLLPVLFLAVFLFLIWTVYNQHWSNGSEKVGGFPQVAADFGEGRSGERLQASRHLHNLSHFQKLSKRPLLVRFNWYSKKISPIHIGYGGKTAMAILKPYGFQETTSDDWDLLWTMTPQWDFIASSSTHGLPRTWQVHNHCLSLTDLRGISGGKVSQWQLFQCMRDKFGNKEFSYMPESLILPKELPILQTALQSSSSPWIVKLSTGKRAQGIHLVTSVQDIPTDPGQYIAQRYVTEPLLIDGRKFHIRLYLVITNLHPLRALLHKEGLVLMAVRNYSKELSTFGDLSVHLTNAAVADKTKKRKVDNSMLLSNLWHYIVENYKADAKKIWADIVDLMTKVVLSEECDQPLDSRISGTCFDVIGVDVLLTDRFKPVLLECNNGPELYTMPKQVKHRKANDLAHKSLLRDLIPLVARLNEPTLEELKSFQSKLISLGINQCKGNPGLEGDCWSQEEIDDLWRLHYEDTHLGKFQRLLPSSKYNKYRRHHSNNRNHFYFVQQQ